MFYLLGMGLCCLSCLSKKKEQPLNHHTKYVIVNDFGNLDSSGRHHILRKEFMILKSLKKKYGLLLEINSHRYQIYSLKSHRIESKGKWPSILQLINQLTGLRILMLHSNEISSVAFANHSKLKFLNLSSNNLPDTLIMPSDTKSLKRLSLQAQGVKHLVFPDDNYKLEKITVSDTQIQYLDDSWAKLKRLEWLWLNNNKLQSFDIHLPKLKELNLYNNHITDTNLIKRKYPKAKIYFGRSAGL